MLILVGLRNEQSKSAILRSASKLKASIKWPNLYVSPWRKSNQLQIMSRIEQCRNVGGKNLFLRKGRLVTIEWSQRDVPPPSASPMEEGMQQST